MAEMRRQRKRRILLVDDSEIVLDVLREILEGGGYEVETVTSAFQLPHAVRAFKPELILLDLNMPALSGQKAAEISARHDMIKGIPIVFHSDRSEQELAQVVTATGAAGFIQKTGDADKFLRQVQTWLPAS